MDSTEVEPETLRWRKWYDRQKQREGAIIVVPPTAIVVMQASKKKRGPRPWPWKRLGKWGKAKRLYFENKRSQATMASLLEAAAAAAAEMARQEAEREAERVEGQRQRRLLALDYNLGVRNPDANGPAALMLRAAARVDGDFECPIANGDVCDDMPRSMRCCGNAICSGCLGEWLRRNNQPTDVGYGDGDYDAPVDGESEMRASQEVYRGRRIRIPMNTHRCPFCSGMRSSRGEAEPRASCDSNGLNKKAFLRELGFVK